jgi:nicotinamide phosphoribosyltransferase
MKTPTTDSGKFSLPGRLQVIRKSGVAMAYPKPASWEDNVIERNEMITVYDCRPIEGVWDETFEQTRERVTAEWSSAPTSADVISTQLREKIKRIISKR